MIRIFISSVRSEFAEERQRLYDYIRTDALLKLFFEPYLFEANPASDSKTQDLFLSAAEESEIYVGIWGCLSGNVAEGEKSPTELEYDAASAKNRYRIIFVKELGEGETRDSRETALIRRAEGEVVRKKFTDYEEWDSLCGLSVIAMLDSDYGMTMKNKEILEFDSIGDFCKAVIK